MGKGNAFLLYERYRKEMEGERNKILEKRWVRALALFFLFGLSSYVSYLVLGALVRVPFIHIINYINFKNVLIVVIVFFLIAIILASGGKRHRLKSDFSIYNEE
jgi:sulfite exporter TauE/SafE